MDSQNEVISRYYDGMTFYYRYFYSTAGLHYGLWNNRTYTLRQAILNHKRAMFARLGPVTPDSHILDAGCGAGWTSVYFSQLGQCGVTGITLSAEQVALARQRARRRGVADRTRFLQQDFCHTGFAGDSFTHAFASESACHAVDKTAFLREMFRVLKPGGRLVIADYYLHTDEPDLTPAQRRQYDIFRQGFVVPGLPSWQEMKSRIHDAGFQLLDDADITRQVRRTAYHIQARALVALPFALLLRALRVAPAEVIPHLVCCLYQPTALKALGAYHLVTLEKPVREKPARQMRANNRPT